MEFILNEFHRDISDNDLLSDMKRVATILNQTSLSREEYKQYGKYSYNTFRRRFGGWNNAQLLCGLTPRSLQLAAAQSGSQHRHITNEELLSDIRRVATLLGKNSISSGEYKQHCMYSKDTCLKRFSTWKNALTLAGLKPIEHTSNKRIEDNILLEEIERLWISLGRQPTTTDIKNGLSTFSLNSYTRHFGSWRTTLNTFIDWINSEKDIPLQATSSQLNSNPYSSSSKNSIIQHTEPPLNEEYHHATTRSINLRLRFKVMHRDNFKCCFCGASPATTPGVELHIDHIIPWSKGGETTLDNLQTLCSNCNLGKSDLIIK